MTEQKYYYLHGFASGPQSSKARFFKERFAAAGLSLHIPDLTEGDFEHSTITQQLRLVTRTIAGGPAVLLGSSMGGYLAALYAARHAAVRSVVLLAPAFGLARRWAETLDPESFRLWRERRWREVFHHGEKRERRIGFALIEDGWAYEEFPDVRQPALVLHGRRDDSVDFRLSERFAESRPNVELEIYDSDHQLLDVLEAMWGRVERFLESKQSR